jgi:tetratricopeptide (TPR) repeat protein
MTSLPVALLALLLGLPPRARAAADPVPAPADSRSELETALAQGYFDRAIRAGEQAVKSDPGSSVAHDLLGRAYGLKAQESQLFAQPYLARKARACFEKAVELDPRNVSARSDLATYDMRAPVFLGGGMKKARSQAEEVLRLDAARGHELLGELAERDKDPVEAEAQFRKAVEASPPGELRGRRALSAFLVRGGRFPAARQLWLDLLEDPPDGAARFELAGIALASGEGIVEAAESLEAALASAEVWTDPSRAEAYERLAALEQRLGRTERARAHLQEALRLEPYRTEWRRSLARLR